MIITIAFSDRRKSAVLKDETTDVEDNSCHSIAPPVLKGVLLIRLNQAIQWYRLVSSCTNRMKPCKYPGEVVVRLVLTSDAVVEDLSGGVGAGCNGRCY